MKKIILFTVLVSLYISCVYADTTGVRIFPQQSFNKDHLEATIIEGSDNSLLSFWVEIDSADEFAYSKPSWFTIHIAKSSDNGLSWQKFNKINNLKAFEYYNISLNVATLNTDRLVLAYTTDFNGFFKLVSRYSDDNGVTWSDTTHIPIDIAPVLTYFRSSLHQLNNRLILTYRNRLSSFISFTSFDGANWADPVELTYATSVRNVIRLHSTNGEIVLYDQYIGSNSSLYIKNGINGLPRLILGSLNRVSTLKAAIDQQGKIWLFYQARDPSRFRYLYNEEIYYITSSDGGDSWTEPSRFTNFKGDDYLLDVKIWNGKPLLTFSSTRPNKLSENTSLIYYAVIPDDSDDKAPPYIYFTTHHPEQVSSYDNVTIKAYVDCEDDLVASEVYYKVNKSEPARLQMYDDGQHNDSLANDGVYAVQIGEFAEGDHIEYYCIFSSANASMKSPHKNIFINISNTSDTIFFDLNRFSMLFNNKGDFGKADDAFNRGQYDGKTVLYSGGLYLFGYEGNRLWGNGLLGSSRINDYLPGPVGSDPNDTRNKIYMIDEDDAPFGDSWQKYKFAVEIGAPFYDGNGDSIYTPIDLNNNGQWDENEDKPEILGDVTTWCIFNDAADHTLRRFYEQYPLGIEIQQSVFAFEYSSWNELDSKIYFRYRITNKGNNDLNRVYFSVYNDPDIGDINDAYWDDLVGCDTLLNLGYGYNQGPDNEWGEDPPALGYALLQGPAVYIPVKSYIDNNHNNQFDIEIDTPLDTAFYKNGDDVEAKVFPGAMNINPSNFAINFYSPFGIFTIEHFTSRLRSLDDYGSPLDPCTYFKGQVLGGIPCENVNPMFHFSGDPLAQTGWINTFDEDIRSALTVGEFNLNRNEPVDIMVVYAVGRGINALNSVEVMKNTIKDAHRTYIEMPLNITEIEEPLPPTHYSLEQNYPNPFNPVTKIRFSIPSVIASGTKQSQIATLKVYDLLGQEITTLVNEVKPAGTYEVEFDGSRLASGVYFYQLKAGNYISTKKMVLVK